MQQLDLNKKCEYEPLIYCFETFSYILVKYHVLTAYIISKSFTIRLSTHAAELRNIDTLPVQVPAAYEAKRFE